MSVVSYSLLLLQHHHTSFDCIMKEFAVRCLVVWLLLVEGFNPSENTSQIGSFQQVGVKIQNLTHLLLLLLLLFLFLFLFSNPPLPLHSKTPPVL